MNTTFSDIYMCGLILDLGLENVKFYLENLRICKVDIADSIIAIREKNYV